METTLTGTKQTVVIGPDHPLVIIGERINPTGRKKLAKALEDRNLKRVQEEAVKQVQEGAHVLDVNVGISGIDEPALLKEALQAVREVTEVPLCIDSALPRALEAGLQVYKGKALVNSVNGEERKLKEVLPLVKQYGAAVIGLTMDDDGIPKEASKRLEIARKIVEEAQKIADSFTNVRVDIDDSSESLGKKIRNAEKEWIPYIAVVGEKEAASGKLAVRVRATKEQKEMDAASLQSVIAKEGGGRPWKNLNLPRLLSKRPIFRG